MAYLALRHMDGYAILRQSLTEYECVRIHPFLFSFLFRHSYIPSLNFPFTCIIYIYIYIAHLKLPNLCTTWVGEALISSCWHYSQHNAVTMVGNKLHGWSRAPVQGNQDTWVITHSSVRWSRHVGDHTPQCKAIKTRGWPYTPV